MYICFYMKNYSLFFILLFTLLLQCMSGNSMNTPTLQSPLSAITLNNFEAFMTVGNVTGANGYQFQYDTLIDFSSPHLRGDTSSKTYFTTKMLLMGKRYYWRARAFKSGDTSDWSLPNYFTVFTKTNLGQPTNNSSGNVRNLVSYNVASYSTATYFFEADTTPLFNSPLHVLKTTSLPSFADTPLFNFGYTIYWRARAANNLGDTLQWSDTWKYTITTKPEFNGNLSGVNPEFRFSWTSNYFDINETVVQTDTSPTFSSTMLTEKLIPKGFSTDTLKQLMFGKKYYVRIRSKFGDHYSDWSNTRIFTVSANGNINSPYQGQTLNALTGTFTWTRLDGTYTQFELYKDSTYTQLINDTVLYNSSGFYGSDTLAFETRYYLRIRYYHARDTTPWVKRDFKVYGGAIVLSSPFNNQQNLDVRATFRFRRENWASSYIMFIDTGLTFRDTASSYRITATTFKFDQIGYASLDTTLRYGQNYSWRVLAVRGSDTTEPSYTSTFKTKTAPVLYFPSNNMVGIGTQTNALITGINGSAWVQWQLDTSAEFQSGEHYEGTAPHVPDDFTPAYVGIEWPEELLFDSRYYWRVRCINAIDTSAWSSPFNFTTTTDPYLSEPANNALNQEINVKLRWSVQGSSADYTYQYQLSTNDSFANASVINLAKGASAEVTVNCAYKTKYYWRVRAFHSRDTSVWSATFSFTTKPAPVINPPQLLFPGANATNLPVEPLTLAWSTLSNVSAYEIEIAKDAAFTEVLTRGSTEGTAVLFSGMLEKSRYYWHVRGTLGSIIGPWSVTRWFETASLTGLFETTTVIPFSMQPNPASAFINITAEQAGTVAVFNSTGQCVFSNDQLQKEHYIHTGNWNKGVYFVMIRTKEGQATKRLLVH